MPAKVSRLFICPRCQAASSAETRPKVCPKCKYMFKGPNQSLAKEFSWEKLPDEQYYEIVQQEVERLLDAPLKDLLGEKGAKIPEEVTIHRKQKVEHLRAKWNLKKKLFMRDASPEQLEALMMLVFELMGFAVPSGDAPKIRIAAIMGKKIGELAGALEGYLKSGGQLLPPDRK